MTLISNSNRIFSILIVCNFQGVSELKVRFPHLVYLRFIGGKTDGML